MALGYLVVALLAAAVAVFALQNTTQADVRFIVWSLRSVPLAALVLGSFAAGAVLVGVPLWFTRWRLANRARALQTQVSRLETALADRDRAPLAQRPSSDPP